MALVIRPCSNSALAASRGPSAMRRAILRAVTRTTRATGHATLPTAGRRRGGIASAAACATRIGSDLTLVTKTLETMTGCWTKPLRKPRTPARADLGETFSGRLASETTR